MNVYSLTIGAIITIGIAAVMVLFVVMVLIFTDPIFDWAAAIAGLFGKKKK